MPFDALGQTFEESSHVPQILYTRGKLVHATNAELESSIRDLHNVLKLIGKKENWCKAVTCVTTVRRIAHVIPVSVRHKYCVIGALSKVRANALATYAIHLQLPLEFRNIPAWNDSATTRHGDIIAGVKAAIRDLESRRQFSDAYS